MQRNVSVEIGLNIKFDDSQQSSFAGIIQDIGVVVQMAFFKNFGRETELIRESLGKQISEPPFKSL